MADTILTYVDACLLIAAFQNKSERDQTASGILNDKRRVFLASDALWMEVMPAPRRNKRQREIDFYERFFARARHLPMSDAIMRRARGLSSIYHLDAMDAIHIAHAIDAGADEFVSAENSTKPMFAVQEMPVLTVAMK